MLASASAVWAVIGSPLANHLLQSTAFAVVAGLLTIAIRKNQARARHWIWLLASVKFLVPFSVLMGIGGTMGWRVAPAASTPRLSFLVEEVSQPFLVPAVSPVPFPTPERFPALPVLLMVAWFAGSAVVLSTWYLRWRRVGRILHGARPMPQGREVDALRQVERMAGVRNRIEVVSPPESALAASDFPLEPGVWGIWRPVLWLPAGIADQLTDAQLEAILAHEVCHVRRRDNLAAVIHMVVEALFWFHPLVWWLGSRLVEERERACDEEVLGLGSEPQVYAESILKACEFYLESSVACVSGVTGADLNKRVEQIMTHPIASPLGLGRKLLLAAAGLTALCGPIAIGVVNAAPSRTQSQDTGAKPVAFEVASVKPNLSGRAGHDPMTLSHGNFTIRNVSLKTLMSMAYRLQGVRIAGGPGWLDSDRYDIVAKGGGDADTQQVWLMLQTLLEERFKLRQHRETRELPIYALVTGKGGTKLHKVKDGDCNIRPTGPGIAPLPCGEIARAYGPQGGYMWGSRVSLAAIANGLSGIMERPVVDQTGLQGEFELNLQWTPEGYRPAPHSESEPSGRTDSEGPGASIFSAVEEQLGLKLEGRKGPVEILVIDHAEKVPVAN